MGLIKLKHIVNFLIMCNCVTNILFLLCSDEAASRMLDHRILKDAARGVVVASIQ